jgi:hypothetical protein
MGKSMSSEPLLTSGVIANIPIVLKQIVHLGVDMLCGSDE